EGFRIGPPGQRQGVAVARDPGRLHFNHALHLSPGQKSGDSRSWTLGDIKDEKLRERYRGQQPMDQRHDTAAVRLDCVSCHQLDPTQAPRQSGPTTRREPGNLMLTVNYELHCEACHPLTFDPALPRVEAPHHLQPADLRRFLWGVYAETEVRDPVLQAI